LDSVTGKRISKSCQTRWASKLKIIHIVDSEWNNLISVFSRIIEDQSSGAESINGARGYLKHFQNFEFAFLTGFCNEIFNITDLFVFLFYNVNA
jgi:hypothetical protein